MCTVSAHSFAPQIASVQARYDDVLALLEMCRIVLKVVSHQNGIPLTCRACSSFSNMLESKMKLLCLLNMGVVGAGTGFITRLGWKINTIEEIKIRWKDIRKVITVIFCIEQTLSGKASTGSVKRLFCKDRV